LDQVELEPPGGTPNKEWNMRCRMRRCLWLGAIAVIASTAPLVERRLAAEPVVYPNGRQDLFYNYYVPAGPEGGVPAQLYVCPRPVPPNVGHTWYTYQPLMPHEYLYPHKRTYWRYNAGSGMTQTKVRWGFNPFNQVWGHGPRVLPTSLPVTPAAKALMYTGHLGVDERW
jgi:hypothetical protein